MLEEVSILGPERYKEYEYYFEYYNVYGMVMKCKELGLYLNANDFDIEQINIMFDIYQVSQKREMERAKSGGKT